MTSKPTAPPAVDERPYRLGVGLMLLNRQGLVFVGRRIGMRDGWQMPQGGIDEGEDPRTAALRELKEEVGSDAAKIIAESDTWLTYDLPPKLRGKKLWGGRYRGQKQKWFALRFLGKDSDIDLAAHGHPEFSAWKWVPVSALLDLIVPFKRELYRQVVAELGPYAKPL